jgi:hypothetical protein
MNYQEEFSRGYAGNALPNDPDALAAWNAGVRTREENERVTHANSPNATDLSVTVPQFGGPEAPAAATTPLARRDAWSAVTWSLGLIAFVVLMPITLPASGATPFAALMLVVFGGAPRPSFGRAVGASFLGLLAYFAIVAGTLAPMFPASAIEGITSLRSLLRLLAPQLGMIVMVQLIAVAGYAVVAAWRLAGGIPKFGLVARAFVAGVIGLLTFTACLLALAPTLGQA